MRIKSSAINNIFSDINDAINDWRQKYNSDPPNIELTKKQLQNYMISLGLPNTGGKCLHSGIPIVEVSDMTYQAGDIVKIKSEDEIRNLPCSMTANGYGYGSLRGWLVYDKDVKQVAGTEVLIESVEPFYYRVSALNSCLRFEVADEHIERLVQKAIPMPSGVNGTSQLGIDSFKLQEALSATYSGTPTKSFCPCCKDGVLEEVIYMSGTTKQKCKCCGWKSS